MSDERERIEKMAAEGKISTEEAERLKTALEKSEEKEATTPPRVPTEGPELSRLAVTSLVLAVAGLPLSALLGVLGLAAMLTGLVLGIVALVQIRNSGGKLYGKGFALAGLILPVLLVPCSILAYLCLGGNSDSGLKGPLEQREQREQREQPRTEKRVMEVNAQAALALAEKGRGMVEAYLKFKKANPGESWQPKKLKLGKLDPDGTLGVEDAVVLYGAVLIASASEKPMAFKTTSQLGSDPQVQIGRGTYTKGGKTIPCYQFKAAFKVPGGQEKGSARVIVRLAK